MQKLKYVMKMMLVLTMPCTLSAQDAAVTAGAGFDAASHYIWRGQKLSEKVVLQPSVDMSYKQFSVNYWTNNDLDLNETTETDLTLNYSLPVDGFSLDLGYINYAFDGFADTQEFYIGAGIDAPLSPTATLYYDFDEGEGAFFVLAIGHELQLSDQVSLALGADAGLNMGNAIMGFNSTAETFSGLYNGSVSASLSLPATGALAFSPFVGFTFPLSEDAETAIKSISIDGNGSHVYGGVSVALNL